MSHDTLAFVRGIAVIGVVIAVASCNYDWTFRPDGGTSTPTKDGGEPNEPLGDSAPPTPPGPPVLCARGKEDCPPDQYCYFSDRLCGTNVPTGECRLPSGDCKDVPACACNGTTTLTDCEAQKNGVDVDTSGATCASGTFPCGVTQCKLGAQACLSKATGEPQCIDDCAKCPCAAYPACSCEYIAGAVTVKCP